MTVLRPGLGAWEGVDELAYAAAVRVGINPIVTPVGASTNRTQIPIIHVFCLFSALPSLRWGDNRISP